MKPVLLVAILIFTFCAFGMAQNNIRCPAISVSPPGDLVPIGTPVTFTANIQGIDLNKLSYQWSVSSGKLIGGQGTLQIDVLLEKPGDAVTATIEVAGLAENCTRTASAAFVDCRVGLLAEPLPVKLDEFSIRPPQIRQDRLDPFFAELNNEPSTMGAIIEGFRRNTPRLQIERKLNNLLKAIKFRKLPTERIYLHVVLTDENLTELWIVPPGANMPTPTFDNIDSAVLTDPQNYKKAVAEIFAAKQKTSFQK